MDATSAVRPSTSSKPGKNETVQPFRFMDLPPEIRVIIYRLIVVQPKSERGFEFNCSTLMPPALAQVSQQIRTEVLPIHYGENSFDINLDIDVIEYDEDDTPIRQDDDTKFNQFLRKCSGIVQTGGLEHIQKLTLAYSEPVWGDMSNYLFGFELGTGQDRDEDNRVGDDNLDWSDYQAVKSAVETTLKKAVEKPFSVRRLKAHVPVDKIIQVLFSLAKHCPHANQYVELYWDYGH